MKNQFEQVSTLQNELSISDRIAAPTPKFFRILRNVGVVLGAVGSTILLAPLVLPVAITTIAGYLATAGAVTAAISQTTVDYKALAKEEQLSNLKI